MAEDRNNSQGLVGQAHTVRKTKRSCQTSIRFILVGKAGKRIFAILTRVAREETETVGSLCDFLKI